MGAVGAGGREERWLCDEDEENKKEKRVVGDTYVSKAGPNLNNRKEIHMDPSTIPILRQHKVRSVPRIGDSKKSEGRRKRKRRKPKRKDLIRTRVGLRAC